MFDTQVINDTFYQALRDRIASGNPGRVVQVRGQLRPGVLVVENELPGASVDGIAPAETFCLRWIGVAVDAKNAGPLVTMQCEIRYASDGTAANAGMDRGRGLAAMDAELASALASSPMHAAAFSASEIAGGGATIDAQLGWNVFWGPAAFGRATMNGERLERTATVEVFGYGQ